MLRGLILFITGVTAAAGFASLVLPHYVARRIELVTNENCILCTLTIGQVNYSLLSPTQVGFEQLHFKNGEHGAIELDVRVPELHFEFSWRALWDRRIEVAHLVAREPKIALKFGTKLPLLDIFSLHRDWTYSFAVANFTVEQGELQIQQTSPVVSVHRLQLQTSSFGTAVADDLVHVQGEAQLGESGNLHFNLQAANFLKAAALTGDVDLSDQNLSDFTAQISGQLIRLHAHLEASEKRMTSQIRADYRDFQLSEISSQSGETAQFLRQLNQALQQHSVRETASQIPIERKAGESFPNFLARGLMSEAARGPTATP